MSAAPLAFVLFTSLMFILNNKPQPTDLFLPFLLVSLEAITYIARTMARYHLAFFTEH